MGAKTRRRLAGGRVVELDAELGRMLGGVKLRTPKTTPARKRARATLGQVRELEDRIEKMTWRNRRLTEEVEPQRARAIAAETLADERRRELAEVRKQNDALRAEVADWRSRPYYAELARQKEADHPAQATEPASATAACTLAEEPDRLADHVRRTEPFYAVRRRDDTLFRSSAEPEFRRLRERIDQVEDRHIEVARRVDHNAKTVEGFALDTDQRLNRLHGELSAVRSRLDALESARQPGRLQEVGA